MTLTATAACTGNGTSTTAGDGALQAYTPNGRPLANVTTLQVRPRDVATFDVYIVNHSSRPVRVTAAQLVKVHGIPTPTLAHTGLEHGKNIVGIQRQWPPSNVPVTALVSAELPTGASKLAVSVRGDTVGTLYATAGLQLTYRDGQSSRRAVAWGGDITCVVADWEHGAWCDKKSPAVGDKVANFIHRQ